MFIKEKNKILRLKTKLEEVISKINLLSTKSDFIQLIFNISHLFENLDKNILIGLLSTASVYINPIYEVFKNKSFNKALLFVMENNSDESKEEKELVYIGLILSVFVLSNFIFCLKKNTLEYLNEEFHKHFRNIKSFQEAKGVFHTANDIRSKLKEIIFDNTYEYKENSLIYVNLPFFWRNLNRSKALIRTMLLVLGQGQDLRNAFKGFIKDQRELGKRGKKFFLSRGLNNINKTTKKINLFEKFIPPEEIATFKSFIDGFNVNKNASSASYIIEKMTDGFEFQKDKRVIDIVRRKIDNSISIIQEIQCFAEKNFVAYRDKVKDEDYEWSNKIYLISIKVLGLLESLKNANDDQWVRKVFAREFFHWVDDVHQVLNKYDIEDDWDKIQAIIGQENSQIEWKSSFFTSTEELFINEQAEKANCKKILSSVTKAMLGMMNTDGGVIVVGLIESPQSIKREDVKQNLVIKKGFTFFDIGYEFKKKNKNLDSVKREIQDILWNETFHTVEKFNNLWTIEPMEIKNDYSVATIYKIVVSKSEKYIYNVKKEKQGSTIWITLTKRADGRTIHVDPRDYPHQSN